MKIKELINLYKNENIKDLYSYLEINEQDYYHLLETRKEVINTCLDCEKDYSQCLAWILRGIDIKINERKSLESALIYNASKDVDKKSSTKKIKKSNKTIKPKEEEAKTKKRVKEMNFKMEELF